MTTFAPSNPARLTMAAAMALMAHGALVWGLLAMQQASYTPPISSAGFEVVDLSAFGVTMPPPQPVEEDVVEDTKEEPEPDPGPEVAELEPAPLPIAKSVAKPKPKPAPKPAQTAKLKPTPQPKTPQHTTESIGSQNAFVAPSSVAAYLRNPKPAYPAMALRRGMQGLVLLLVKVSDRGEPLTVTIKKSSGFMLLDKAALKAVRAWRFAPATRGGRSVAAGVEVPIRFSLNDA